MAYLCFIEDQKLEEIIGNVLMKGQLALKNVKTKFNRNVIDPFSILFEMGSFEISIDQWTANEEIRQAQKSLSNAIGLFHQNILGSIKGWQLLPTGGIVDIVNHDSMIIGEVKNKHNTLKGSDKSSLYYKIEDLVMRKGHMYKGYTVYYIEIIPKKCDRYNIEFTPPDASTGAICTTNSLIRQIDGYSFYALATGIDNALEQLFVAIPQVIKKLKPHYSMKEESTIREFFNQAFLE